MKKFVNVIFILTLIISLAACASTKLADIYNEDDVISRAKKTVEVINTLAYDAMVSEMRDDLESQITSQQLKDAWGPALNEAGKFVDYTSTTAYGQKSQSTEEDYAVVVLICKYENANLTYTIFVDKDLNVVGMYMR